MLQRSPIAWAITSLFVSIPLLASAPVLAADADARELAPVVVTGNPLGSSLSDLAAPVTQLEGRELDRRRQSTLGETVAGLPGVSASYFGPNASRPIIRGLDGDRVRVLQNGTGMQDVSSLSPDHATAVDPLLIERIEVVRGPAALLYGGNAVGGVVNVIDNRIPTAPVDGLAGRGEVRYGSADDGRNGTLLLEAGNGQLALHADVASRSSNDLRIPGAAWSARKQARDGAGGASGRLPNSDARADSGSFGAAWTGDDGYLGLAYGGYNSNYGTVAEDKVRIDMRSERFDVAGERRNLDGFIDSVRFKYNHTDYAHDELDSGTPATRFRTQGGETRLEATHRALGNLRGSFGLQLGRLDFSAAGDEAFLPTVDSKNQAIFVFEEASFGATRLSAGVRVERTRHVSDGGGSADASTGLARFGSGGERQFTGKSGALGVVQTLGGGWSLAGNLTHTERAPTYAELFANGLHAATNLYEVGNADLAKEQSNGADVRLRWQGGPHSASVGAYLTRFANYIGLAASGTERCADGAIGAGAGSCGGEDPLAEHRFTALKARFAGVEAEGRFRIYDRVGTADLRLFGDYVQATNRDTGEALPRIAPLRLGLGGDYRFGAFSANLDLTRVFAQKRVAAGELPTDGYTLVNLALNYRMQVGATRFDAFLQGNNLLDREARVHASYLKDIAPLPGRGVQLGVRAAF